MDDLECPGCGKRSWSLDGHKSHIRSCKKFLLLQVQYNIPTVKTKDIQSLQVRRVSDGKEWGIWNKNTNDWVRDKTGLIDSRLFQRNAKEFLNQIVAESLLRSN